MKTFLAVMLCFTQSFRGYWQCKHMGLVMGSWQADGNGGRSDKIN